MAQILTPPQSLMEGETDMHTRFQALKTHAPVMARTDARSRIKRLKALRQSILRHQMEIQAALQADFGKNATETDLSEILAVTSEISTFTRHLPHWMRRRKVPTPLSILGHQSRVILQPKGVVLIISPWNFPVNLTFIPLVAAIAAGNTVALKPSEFTPQSTAVMAKIVAEVFPPEEVSLFAGGVSTAQALLDHPFNHIFFTGSPRVGKIVMAKAAEHLASVTLELGGKSPTIVTREADVRHAANRIAWGKFMNAGQICIAPDYVLVHESRRDELIEQLGQAIAKLYGPDPAKSPDYARIISDDHYERLLHYLHEAATNHYTIHAGGQSDAKTRYIAPTVITGVTPQCQLMHEEIFGPILPVLAYRTLQEAIDIINARPKPLALYVFGKKRQTEKEILAQTRAGGGAYNTTLTHFFNNEMPFGGDNNSGIGKSHGYSSFLAFSNERAIVRQPWKWSSVDLIQPPYGPLARRMSQFFIRWF